MIEPYYYPESCRTEFIKAIKDNVKVPIIAVNSIKHPLAAEQQLQDGVSDFVGMARMHIADPDIVKKTRAGREDLIRKCLGCMNCNKSIVAGQNLHCALNPVAGGGRRFGGGMLIKNGGGGQGAGGVGGGAGGGGGGLVWKRGGGVAGVCGREAAGGGGRLWCA